MIFNKFLFFYKKLAKDLIFNMTNPDVDLRYTT